ncbi:iron-sulfur cluster assembly protein [Candidatus Liberibacter asiaticus]|nr:iron-sulfur cluster assembly protein [Candidatus Liberibacter asiaticus]ACT56964.1 Mrp protein [Candidatus Liberibacter asiaticus str. psy62]ACT57354.1 Mrp protein [Candidatus Liberibacter asiaticus str. psy62]AGH16729.1 hypothetical protein WSI_01795 [Candidatus Liberibacter asiaticus str. gxpsy]ALK07104.1 DUF59 domain-containing protein [Candidatus Liberibacter asiaticus]ALK07431.1 DUF59 domain-containing protein [Candidatus Liberibacter asiaticus]
MNQILKNQIVDSLKVLSIPGEKNNIVEMQRLSEIFIVHNTVYLSITVPHTIAHQLQSLRSNAQQIIQNIPTVKNAVVTLTENKNPPQQRNNLNVKKFVAVA